MAVDLVTFRIKNLPSFYVAGTFEATSPWLHKHLYQPGNWEVMIILEGVMYIDIEGEQYVVKKNQYLLVPPYKNVVGYRECPVGTKTIWVHFFPRDKVVLNDIEAQKDFYSITIPRQASIFNAQYLLTAAYQVIDLSESFTGYAVDIAVSQFLTFISDDYQELIKSNESDTESLERVKVWIESHLNEIENSKQIADEFNFNVIYLNRIFKKVCNVSLYVKGTRKM